MFRGSPEDVSIGASVLRDPDGTVRGILINRRVSFFDSEWYLLGAAGPIRLPVPARSSFRGFVAGQLIFSLEQAWNGRAIPAGALVSLDLAACLAEPQSAAPDVDRGAGRRAKSIEDVATTRSRLLVTLYRNVRGSAVAYRFEDGRWIGETLPLPEHASVHLVGGSDRDERAFLDVAGYLTPNTLYLADAAAGNGRTGQVAAAAFRRRRPRRRAVRGGVGGRHVGALFRRAPEGVAVRRRGADTALRLWRVPGVDDPVLFRRARQAVARKRRRLCGRQYPRRRRVRPGLAPRRAEARPVSAPSTISSRSPRI